MLGDCIWYDNNLCDQPAILSGKKPIDCIGFNVCKSFIVTDVQDGIDYIKAQDGEWIPK